MNLYLKLLQISQLETVEVGAIKTKYLLEFMTMINFLLKR